MTNEQKPNGPCGTVNIIFRCKCRTARPAHNGLPARAANPNGLQRTVVANKSRKYTHTDRFGTHHYSVSDDAPVFLKCDACNRTVSGQMVKGVKSDKHTCGAKCLTSFGTSCTCSCGGKNHGMGWALLAEFAADMKAEEALTTEQQK